MDRLEVFPWNKNFETGIERIDDQHKILISILNKLALTLTYNNPIEINRVFKQLIEYAEFHFESEEEIWIEYLHNDSWLSSHQLSHSSFLPKIFELKNQDRGKTNQRLLKVSSYF